MTEAADHSQPAAAVAEDGAPASVDTDMSALIRGARELVGARASGAVSWSVEDLDYQAFAQQTGFAARRKGKPEMVLAGDIAVELGHPSSASQVILLTTTELDMIRPRQVTRVGPDFDSAKEGERRPFAQVVLVALRPDATPDPFELDSAQFLINRLPGYMVRSIPGRLWVRVSKRGRAAGLSLDTVARALICAYEQDFDEVEAVEILFVTSSIADVEALAPVALEAEVIRGQHKKLAISPDGELDCNELTCETCDEKPVCDDLREVVRERRRRKTK